MKSFFHAPVNNGTEFMNITSPLAEGMFSVIARVRAVITAV